MDSEAKRALITRLGSRDEELRRQAMASLKGVVTEDDLTWLVGPLSDESWRVRKEAIEALAQLDPAAELVNRLIPLMDPRQELTLRNSIVEVIERMGRGAAVHVAENLHIEQVDTRKFLVDILGSLADPGVIPQLIPLLRDPEDNIRAAAAESLARIGDPASTGALIEVLEEADGWVAFSVLSALARIGNSEALPVFFRYIDDRILANPAIEGIGNKGDVEDGIRLMGMQSVLSRGAAKLAFVAAGMIYRRALERGQENLDRLRETVANAADETIVAFLTEQLSVSEEHPDRRNYLAILSLIGGDKALQSILSLIDDDGLEWDVNMALLAIGRRDRTAVTSLMNSHDELVRRKAVQVVGQLGEPDLLEHVYPMLKDESGHVRRDAARAVASLGDSRSFGPLIELISDEYRDVAESAAESLAHLGQMDPGGLSERIRALLSGSSVRTRALLLRVMSEVDAEGNLPFFLSALHDVEPEIRAAALNSIKRTGDEEVVTSIINSLADESPEVRVEAAMALEDLQPQGAVEPLKAALFDQDLLVRTVAISALAAQPGMEAKDLAQLLSDEDLMIRTFVIEALGRRGARGFQDAVELMEDAFREESVEMKRSICRAMAQIPGDRSFQLLLDALRDADASVRAFAVQAIASVDNKAVIDVLRDLSENDPDRIVRDTARSLTEGRK